MHALPYEEREALMRPARLAIAGKRRSHDDLCRRALGKQRTARMSDDEAEIFGALWEAGLHNTRRKREQDAAKYSYLKDNGWRVLVFPALKKPRLYHGGHKTIPLERLVRVVVRAVHG